jgi:hypothetical protein
VNRWTIYFDLAEHWKCHIISSREKLRDLGGIAWLLGAELIARKAWNRNASGTIFAMKRLEPFVLRCKATFARGVYHKQHLSREI